MDVQDFKIQILAIKLLCKVCVTGHAQFVWPHHSEAACCVPFINTWKRVVERQIGLNT